MYRRSLALSCSLMTISAALQAADGMPELDGTWQSPACELRPQAGPEAVQPWFLERRIDFSGNRIDAHFTTFADPQCSIPLVELEFGGDVIVQGSSTVAPGAKEVDLLIDDYLEVTPRTAQFADFLASAGPGTCGSEDWAPGVTQDLLEGGCSVMGIDPDSPTREYEVLHVSAGQLFFGARPVDGSSPTGPEQRPTALQVPLALAAGGMTRSVGADDLRSPEWVEIVTFEQREGADPAEVRAFFEEVTAEMNRNDTLLYRTVAQGENRRWLCVNYWTSREAMETLNAQAQEWKETFAEMGTLAKPDSFRLESYALNND